MRIVVYVPCHNNEKTLPEVLKAIRSQTRAADQLLFINDRCTDRSPEIAKEYGFDVHTLPEEKSGLAAGRNLALQLASGDVVQGVDGDVFLTPDYLAHLETVLTARPDIAAVAGRLDERYTQTLPNLWRAAHMAQHYGDRAAVNPRVLPGATMAIRTDAAKQIGGWDERFKTAFDDVDICNRMRGAGLQMLYTPECRAWHLRQDTLESVLRTHWKWNYLGYEQAFANVQTWLDFRLPGIWHLYRRFRAEDDLWLPQLARVTLLLPWDWLTRDIHEMGKMIADIGSPLGVADLAARVLARFGFEQLTVDYVTVWIRQLAASLDASPQGSLLQQVSTKIWQTALESIPDHRYSGLCQEQILAASVEANAAKEGSS